jgi:SanA protein
MDINQTHENRRHKFTLKRFWIGLVCFCLVGLLLIAGMNLAVMGSKDYIVAAGETAGLDADCILVLGAGITDAGNPSPMLQDRLLQGIALYEAGAAGKLLMSGDHGQTDYDEVNVMKQFAVDYGVASEDVFMDHAGFSTYESLYRARDVFAADKIIIVTQKYHLYRALYIADVLGIEAYGVASDSRTYQGQAYRELREILARCKDFIVCLFQPPPTFLGEAIPVSGDGDQTND